MPSGYKPVQLPEYIYNLLERAVSEHKALNLSDAVNHGISSYLGIKYISMSDIRAKDEMTQQMNNVQRVTDLAQSIRKTDIPDTF